MYPYNHKMGQTIQTNVDGIKADRGFIAHYIIPAVEAVAPSNNAIKTATTLADGLTTTLTTADINQPSTPRVLSITGVGAETAGNVVITGKDMAGESLVETIIAAGATTVAGTKVFASIETIVLPARGASGNTIAIGATGAFGLPFKLAHDTILKILNDNIATTVASSSFSVIALANNFITPTAALAAKQIDVYLIV